MRFNPQQAPLSYQNKRTLFYQENQVKLKKYNMAVGPIRKTITVESNAVNYDGGRVPLKIKGEVTDN
jgi:hypothetical protein